METAFAWGDEIPVGIIYRNNRESYESKLPILGLGTLVSRYESKPA
jgi:hypothetical protein